MNDTTFKTSLCVRVGKHKGLVTGAKIRRNAIVQCMFLEASGGCSRSNRLCTTKILNNICGMVGGV